MLVYQWGMADKERDGLLGRILHAMGLKSDEIAAGHGSLPEPESRPSTRSRNRSREHQRERSSGEESEKAAEAIAEAANALDEQIRQSVDDAATSKSSEEMVKKAKERWSSD